MRHPTLLFCLLLLAFISCKKKDNDPEPKPEPTPNTHADTLNTYFPMKNGNYWVYEFRNHLPDGSISSFVTLDTLRVTGDTIINGLSLKMLTTNKPTPNTTWLLHQVNKFIYTLNGTMALPPGPQQNDFNRHYGFQQPQNDTLYEYWDVFPDTIEVNSQLGSFTCLEQFATHYVYPAFGERTIVDTSYFANIGPVQRSYAYLSGTRMVGKLVDYHLEE